MSDDALSKIGAFARDLVVQAGAGTGKTHALVTLYLHLVTGLGERSAPVTPSRILVITFTDKAAGELRDRIRARLERLLQDGLAAEPVLRASAEQRGRNMPNESWLRSALAELTRAPIGTFHAIGQSLLRRRARQAGIDPSFALMDNVEAEARALDAARSAALEALAQGDEGAEALVQMLTFGGRGRPGLIESLVRLRGALAEQGRAATGIADAYEAALIAHELDEARAALRDALVDIGALADVLGDKTSARARELGELASSLDDPATTLRAIADKTRNMRPPKEEVAKERYNAARDRLKACTDALADAQAAIDYAPMARSLEALLVDTERRYAEGKREAQVVDFGDLIRLPRDLLRADEAIAQEEASRYEALLVDEFQDTNAVQAELVELLARGAQPEVGGRRFVVGDRKQSIYEFRGADVAVFTNTADALKEAGADELLLRRSFRSTPRVIELCNALFAHAFGAGPPAAAWALAFDPARDALAAQRTNTPDAKVELLRTLDAEEDPTPNAEQLRRREADAIAKHARRCIDAGRRPGDLALLLRRYTYLPTYLHALRRAGVPYYVVRGRGFYEAQEIRDLASLVTLLCDSDSDDRLALVATLRSPLCGLSDDGLARLALAKKLDWRSLRHASLDDTDGERLVRFVARVDALQAQPYLGPAALLREIVERFELRAILAATSDGVQKIANVEQLVLRARALETSGTDLPAFARWLMRAVRPEASLDEAEAQVVDERDDVLRVMTIHQSKGLEFPIVYVADCGAREQSVKGPIYYEATLGLGIRKDLQHSTPSRRVYDVRTLRGRAESLRLFYVAATRARDRLVFSGEPAAGRSWREALGAVFDDLDVVERHAGTQLVLTPQPVEHAVDVASLPALQPFAPQHARSLRVAVTQLHDFASCARRYHLVHELSLDEPRPGKLARTVTRYEDDEALDVRSAGTLAHDLLERCTFGLQPDAARTQLHALAESLGHDPHEPAVAEIVTHTLTFLRSAFAQGLAGRAVRRELPFSLALPSRADLRVLRGQMDLVVLDSDGVYVVDYKHARRPHGDAVAAYRFQLEAYAAAAAALYPRAPRIVVGLVYLRDDEPTPLWLDVADPTQLATKLGAVADELAAARLSGARPLAQLPTCRAIDCGFVGWCHPMATATAATEGTRP